MRLLVVTFYYEPDLCAGSFRATALVKALRARAPRDLHIEVLTTLPNRYRSYNQEAPRSEQEDGFEIRRIALPAHSSDMRGQSRAFARFAREALRFTKGRKYDVVFATSSRLMSAALASLIARRSRARLYLDIRDNFVETISELLPGPIAWPLRHALPLVEAWTTRRAQRINVVSPGFEAYFRTRYPQIPLSCFTNGIDDEFLDLPPAATVRRADGRAVVLYAGNLGEGQGLHHIVPGLARALRDRAHFVVIGDGGRRKALEQAIAGLDNVELRDPVTRRDLIAAYQSADLLFLHLGDYEAFEKVLPSKLFEYAALGKPVLAGVAGYAARFVRSEITNAAVFAPCDVDGAVAAFDALQLRDSARPEFVAKYARRNIVYRMADEILELGGARGPCSSA